VTFLITSAKIPIHRSSIIPPFDAADRLKAGGKQALAFLFGLFFDHEDGGDMFLSKRRLTFNGLVRILKCIGIIVCVS
jgi:hypothetical protein